MDKLKIIALGFIAFLFLHVRICLVQIPHITLRKKKL